MPLFALDLGASYGVVGLILAAEGFGTLIGAFPAGKAVGRFGRKVTMLLGSGCTGVFTLLLVWVETVQEAFLLQILSGFGVAFFYVSCHAYMAETVVVENRGKAIALYGGINRFGLLVGPALGGSIGAAIGIRAPFLLCATAYATTLLIVMLFVGRTHFRESGTPGAHRKTSETFSLHLRSHLGKYAPAAGGYLFFQGIRSARAILIPLIGAEALGLDVQAIGVIVSISMAVDLSLFYPAGLIMDNLGRKAAILPSFFIQLVGIALLATVNGFSGLLGAAVIIGLGNGIGSGSMLTLSADLAPKEHRGEFLGLWRLVGEGGRSGTQVLIGGLAAVLSLPAAALIVAASGMTGVGIFARFVPETLVNDTRR